MTFLLEVEEDSGDNELNKHPERFSFQTEGEQLL